MNKNLSWLAPFVCIGLIVAALLRPAPVLSPPAQSRIVVDASGTPVHIEVPFRGVVLRAELDRYLRNTHAPDTIQNAGGPEERAKWAKDFMRAIFPEILKRNSIWDGTHHDELERFLAYDPGVFLGGQLSTLGADTLFRRIGLPVLYTSSETDKDWDDMCFSAARLETALVGNPERGEALIASYKQAFVDLEQELRPETFGVEPRVLMMASSAPGQREFLGALRDGNLYDLYVYRAGLKNAASGWAGVQLVDVERILAMDPDMIFLTAGMPIDQGPKEFMIDPRWRGLKAVQEKRVYLMVGWLDGLDLQQFWTRWMAELAHPDRLQPKFREMLSDHFVKEFGYRLSDEQIDQFLHINENKDQSGYARFRRSQQADDGRSSSQ